MPGSESSTKWSEPAILRRFPMLPAAKRSEHAGRQEDHREHPDSDAVPAEHGQVVLADVADHPLHGRERSHQRDDDADEGAANTERVDNLGAVLRAGVERGRGKGGKTEEEA